MKEFVFNLVAARGLHAQIATELVQMVQNSKSQAYITKGSKSVNLERIMEILSLGIRAGDEIRVTIVGTDEDILCEQMKKYFEINL